MNTRLITALLALAFACFAGIADAQEDGDELEATIRLMGADEAELPEAVTREIVLPPNVSEDAAAVEAAAKGLDTANEARSRGDEGPGQGDRGQDIADEARSGNPGAEARENAADMAEAARENAENRSRGRDSRPDPPGPPELPDTPNQAGQS